MGEKKFKLRADQIRDVAQGHGGCYASDRITVDGLKVGYMYREDPHDQLSGWIHLNELAFSEGGPRAWFVVVRRG